MKDFRQVARMGVLLVLLGLMTGSVGSAATGGATTATASGNGPDPALIAKLKANARGSVSIHTDDATKAVSFVQVGRNGDLLPAKTSGGAQSKAHAFLDEYGALFGVANADAHVVPISLEEDSHGAHHVSYRQSINGIPVFGGIVRAHVDRNGNLTAVNGTFAPDANTVDTTARLSAADAASRAIATVVASPPLNDATGAAADTSGLRATAKLYIYRQGLIRGVAGKSQLAYRVEVTNGGSIREILFVHAQAGKVINRYSAAPDALYRQVFEEAFEPANLVWKEGDPFPGSLTVDQQNIVEFSGDSYNLFFGAFGYDSYDGNGAIMNAVNNDPTIACPNANWNGVTTNYCTGVTGDDTVAHEWGHAYTEYTHNLIYQWQPGALNESYSDIWGEVVDLINGAGTDSPGGKRTVGACSIYTTPIPVLIINTPTPGECAAGGASFGPPLTAAGVTGDLVLVDDGVGVTSDGCETPFVNAAALAGKIALTDRGTCAFVLKTLNAQANGAIGNVIANTLGRGPFGMAGDDPTITIPTLGISNANGDLLKSYLAAGGSNVTMTVKTGTSPPEDSYRWLSGEDDPAFGGAIRDMWTPTCLSDPGKVSDAEYHCDTSDGGGVHTNSGVPNHGFALLVDGGTYNNQTVASIGLVKASHLYWRAQSVYQTPTTDFADHADALEASCADLVGQALNGISTGAPAGPSGEMISAADCAAVTAMIAAVELRLDPTEQCDFKPLLDQHIPHLCTGIAKRIAPNKTRFGHHLANWTLTNVGVFSGWPGTNWVETSELPGGRKGTAAYAENLDGQCDGAGGDVSGYMSMTSASIKLPTGATKKLLMAFDHYIASEFGFDGGNVKISINGGPFTVIPASAYLFNPPNTTLATAAQGNTNPLAGEEAFSGTDGGQVTGTWGQSHIDLAKAGVAAGDTIQIRFDFGMDGCAAIDGWYVQNLLLITCEPFHTPHRTALKVLGRQD